MEVDTQHSAPADSVSGHAEEARQQWPLRVGFHSLDGRVVSLWRVTHLIGFSVVLFAQLVGGIIVVLGEPKVFPLVVAMWLAFAALFLWLSLWRPQRLYRAWGYRIDEKVLETRSGLIFRVLRLLPLSRLQHVDLHRGPLERAFGLASLVLHTAGTHEANITIPGLDEKEAVRLRDHLVEVGGDDAV